MVLLDVLMFIPMPDDVPVALLLVTTFPVPAEIWMPACAAAEQLTLSMVLFEPDAIVTPPYAAEQVMPAKVL